MVVAPCETEGENLMARENFCAILKNIELDELIKINEEEIER